MATVNSDSEEVQTMTTGLEAAFSEPSEEEYRRLQEQWRSKLDAMTAQFDGENDQCLTSKVKSELIRLVEDDLSLLNDLWKLKRSLSELKGCVERNSSTAYSSCEAKCFSDFASEPPRSRTPSNLRRNVAALSNCGLISQRMSHRCGKRLPSASSEVAAASDLLLQRMDVERPKAVSHCLLSPLKKQPTSPRKRCSAVEVKKNFRRNEPQKRSFDSGFYELTFETDS